MPVGIVVVSHSAALASAAAELAREMAGDDLRLALAGGIDDEESPLGTDAVKVMAAIEEVDDPAGVMVLMDLGSAVLSAEMALDLLPPEIAGRVVLCEAPVVEGLIAAAVQAAAGATIEEVVAEARDGLMAKASHLGVSVPAAAAAAAPAADEAEVGDGPVVYARHTVPNDLGFHARPAGRLVERLTGLDADVRITDTTSGRGPVSARSLNGLITLGARRGHELEVAAHGPDAATALERLASLLDDNLGDPPDQAGAGVAGTTTGRSGVDDGSPGEAAAGVGQGASAGEPAGAPDDGDEAVLTGLPAAPGLAVGEIRRLGAGGLPSRAELVAAAGTGGDQHAALDAALATAREQLAEARRRLESTAGMAAAEMVATQLLVLDDPALLEPARAAIEAGDDAATAFDAAVGEVLTGFEGVEDDYLAARAADLDAVGREVLAALAGVVRAPVSPRGVVVAEDLSPAETAGLDPDQVDAIVTAGGSPTAHAALIARALGLPAVVAVGPAVLALDEGREVVVDGTTGRVETAPDPRRREAVRTELERRAAAHERLRAAAAEPAVTLGGTHIEVRANVGLTRDAQRAAAEGADGVGLLRSEFLFLDRGSAPDEEEQVATYTAVCEALEGRPVTLRTLDVGGDKPLDYVTLPAEANPFLGTRGVRLGLQERVLLTTQIRAALRVAAEHPLALMLPMVATLDEIAAVRRLIDEARTALSAEGIGAADELALGVMVEVPALALKADHVVGAVDFLSIGTNDLTQYAMAAERGNAAVSGLSDPLDPGVLALIAHVGEAAARRGVPVAVCGELASDPGVAALLIGLGVTELSVPPVDVPGVKAAVRGVGDDEARDLARRALAAGGAAEVCTLLG